MPAAAVIPAPIAYIKVVVVKKLVVGSRRSEGGSLDECYCSIGRGFARGLGVLLTECPAMLAGLL